jgi:plastocyanin
VKRNPYTCAAAVLVLSLLLCACSSPSKPSTPTAAPAASSAAAAGSRPATPSSPGSGAVSGGIDISGFAYSGTLTVKPGQKVTVTNKDSVAHTLTDKKTHLFDTGNIPANGGTGTFTAPTKPGSYPFGCTYHPDMAGTLIVQG